MTKVILFRILSYGLMLASAGMQFAVVPVLPVYAHRFGLSGLQQGLVLGATGLAALAVSLPAGALADQLGARRLTLWAGVVMAIAMLIQALAGTFVILLLARLLFGIGYAVVWTAGLTWLAEAAPEGQGLSGSVASAGLGGVAGPALAGVMVQYFGLASPFLAAAACFAIVTGALALFPAPRAVPAPSAPIRTSLRAATSDRMTLAAAAAIVTAGGTTGVSALLVPSQLHAAGAPPGRIGLVFALAGMVFVAGSALTAYAGRRAVRTSVILAGMLALALAFSPAALTSAPTAIVAMLCATTAARSVLWTVSYPLAAAGAERSGAGLGLVMGLLNGVWALTVLLGPLVAGLAAQVASPQAVFALTAAACVAVLAVTVPTAGPFGRSVRAEGTVTSVRGMPRQATPAGSEPMSRNRTQASTVACRANARHRLPHPKHRPTITCPGDDTRRTRGQEHHQYPVGAHPGNWLRRLSGRRRQRARHFGPRPLPGAPEIRPRRAGSSPRDPARSNR
jgi:MFS transporter, DHA1 family, solute carrier family 18 (vesicular amine transporter), member 1/2